MKWTSIAWRKNKDGIDSYQTPTWVVEKILDTIPLFGSILEPCSWSGRFSRAIEARWHTVTSQDLRTDDSVYGEKWVDFSAVPYGIVDRLYFHLVYGVGSLLHPFVTQCIISQDKNTDRRFLLGQEWNKSIIYHQNSLTTSLHSFMGYLHTQDAPLTFPLAYKWAYMAVFKSLPSQQSIK